MANRRSPEEATTYPRAPGIELAEVGSMSADADLTVIVNPNNPTGTSFATAEIHALAPEPERLPSTSSSCC